MRLMRLLFVGVLLCIGLQVGEIETAQAQAGLEPGTYQGYFHLSARSYANKFQSGAGSTFSGDTFVYWKVDAGLSLNVIDTNHALLMVKANQLPTDVRQESANYTAGGGEDCIWSDSIYGKGSFLALLLPPLDGIHSNYDPAGRVFTLPLTWSGISTWYHVEGRSHGTQQGCTERWGPGLAAIQQKAIEEMSKQIGEITFTATSFGPRSIGGTCDLPKWKGEFPITSGKATHSLEKCTWKVFPVSTQEWEYK